MLQRPLTSDDPGCNLMINTSESLEPVAYLCEAYLGITLQVDGL